VRIIPGLKDGASVEKTIRLVAQSFRVANIEAPEVDARLLIGHALHLNRTQLIAQSDRVLEAREVNVISALAARRLRHEPVSRILGRKEFWSLMLEVTPAVLVPRPDTETVVEAALDFVVRGGLRMERLRILDIGTGSGALLLALLTELPNALGTGTDISEAALEVARAVTAAVGAERVGIRISPLGAFNATGPFDGVEAQYVELVRALGAMKLAYLHVVDHSSMGSPTVPAAFKSDLRSAFGGVFIGSGGLDKAQATQMLADGKADLVAFGRAALANPDLVERLADDQPLNAPDFATFYTPGEKGYTDYPALAAGLA